MHLTDSLRDNIKRLVIDKIESEVKVIRECGSSWEYAEADGGQLTIEAEKEIEGINRLGTTLLYEIGIDIELGW